MAQRQNEFNEFSKDLSNATNEEINTMRDTIKALRSEAKEALASIKSEADESYANELEEISKEEQYTKKSTTSKKSGKSSASLSPSLSLFISVFIHSFICLAVPGLSGSTQDP